MDQCDVNSNVDLVLDRELSRKAKLLIYQSIIRPWSRAVGDVQRMRLWMNCEQLKWVSSAGWLRSHLKTGWGAQSTITGVQVKKESAEVVSNKDELTGGIIHPIWIWKALGCRRRSWKVLLERGKSGTSHVDCCYRNLTLTHGRMDAWMETMGYGKDVYGNIHNPSSFSSMFVLNSQLLGEISNSLGTKHCVPYFMLSR